MYCATRGRRGFPCAALGGGECRTGPLSHRGGGSQRYQYCQACYPPARPAIKAYLQHGYVGQFETLNCGRRGGRPGCHESPAGLISQYRGEIRLRHAARVGSRGFVHCIASSGFQVCYRPGMLRGPLSICVIRGLGVRASCTDRKQTHVRSPARRKTSRKQSLSDRDACGMCFSAL